ncbi:hypothetical protein ACFL0W_04625 [Nanoarchaeota archaeon]
MRNLTVVLVFALFWIGLFVMADEITGMVVMSESCCFGEDCDSEQLCPAASKAESPLSNSSMPIGLYAGVGLMGLSLFLYFVLPVFHND